VKYGAACRIRTGDPLITKISAREGESGKRLLLSRQGEFTSLEILPTSILFGKEGQQ